MKTKEYGKGNPEVIVLLHGGGLSWWNYRDEAELLMQKYHVILPVLDGHADSSRPFTTIEDNAGELIRYIDENLGGSVLAIGGLSLGGQILIEALSQRGNICRYALIESALAVPMPLTSALIAPAFGASYGLIRKQWFAKAQFKSLKIQEKLFDDYYRDTCKIQKQDMIRFLKSNSSYILKPKLADTTARVAILVGSKEQRAMRHSAEILHAEISGSKMQVLNGYYHGDLSLNHPDEYVELLTCLISAS